MIVEQAVGWKAIQQINPSTHFDDLNSSLSELIQKADTVIRAKPPAGETRAQSDDRAAQQNEKLKAIFAAQTFAEKPVTVEFQVSDVMESLPPKPKALEINASDADRAQYDAELAASQSFHYLVVGHVKSSSKPVLTRSQLQDIKKAEDNDNAIQRAIAKDPNARGGIRENPSDTGPATKQRVQRDANSIVPPHVIQFFSTNAAVLNGRKERPIS